MASEWMTGTNEWLVLANGIRMDDRDKWMISFGYGIWMDDQDKQLISFGWWHSKGMAGVSEQLTSTNDVLR